jgi:hypothetical protein
MINNHITEYLRGVLQKAGAPAEDIEAIADQIFTSALDETFSQISSPSELKMLNDLVAKNDIASINKYLIAIGPSKFKPVFITQIQNMLKSLFETLLMGMDDAGRAELISKLQIISNEEILSQYKDLPADEFLQRIGK